MDRVSNSVRNKRQPLSSPSGRPATGSAAAWMRWYCKATGTGDEPEPFTYSQISQTSKITVDLRNTTG